MDQHKQIQWFPGHMAKTRRLIKENLSLVDLVVELLDARIPQSSRNPEIDRLIGKKPRIVLLNKCDAADPDWNNRWVQWFASQGIEALCTDCRSGKGLKIFEPTVRGRLAALLERQAAKGMAGRPLRIMIVGIPNVGKSSLINRLAGSRRAKVEDRPGVTKGKQWISLSNGLELLDTPGVLWPKFEDPAVGQRLAFVGSIRDEILDVEDLAVRLVALLRQEYPALLSNRYGVEPQRQEDAYLLLQEIARRRGMLVSGGQADTLRCSVMLLDEFRGGKMGRVTLELPPPAPKKEAPYGTP